MNRIAGIIIVIGLVGGCRSPGRRAPEPMTGPHVSVMTYNVNVGGPRADLAAAAIERSGADIVCLQETSPAWEQYLRARLAMQYPACSNASRSSIAAWRLSRNSFRRNS
jgi:endonuclease/exonuclease/phosphatase (EEP) superfamily protein YafD